MGTIGEWLSVVIWGRRYGVDRIKELRISKFLKAAFRMCQPGATFPLHNPAAPRVHLTKADWE